MHLTPDAVVYDIGSGTGSIAVEMARRSDNLTVYAIERKQEAVALIEKNCTKYGLANVKVICGEAPGALTGLPVPTHAFIGGSNGSLKEILTVLYRKNPRMRVVVTAITLEPVGAVSSILNEFPVEQEEIIQMLKDGKSQYAIAKELGVVQSTIAHWMARHGIDKQGNQKKCATCQYRETRPGKGG